MYRAEMLKGVAGNDRVWCESEDQVVTKTTGRAGDFQPDIFFAGNPGARSFRMRLARTFHTFRLCASG